MEMLRSIKNITGYVLGARDGEIGKCSDFLFDDASWAIRYIVADTRKWLPSRKVLISPISLKNVEAIEKKLNIDLTKDQIKEAPPLNPTGPVTRKYEVEYNRYYDWPHYWVGPSIWGPHKYPHLLLGNEVDQGKPMSADDGYRLQSIKEVLGYHIQAIDRDIGHIEDFIFEQESWIVRYLVVDTRNWLPVSKKVLTVPLWVDLVDWKRKKVVINLTSEEIRNSPKFDVNVPVDRE